MSRSVHRAFSLVEVLVVLGIIGIVIAMLFAAVQRVRSAAQVLSCANNLRQQGIALYGFYDDHGGFPPCKINPASAWAYWQDGFGNPGNPLTDFYGSPNYPIYNHTGFTLLLPYLEESSLARSYNFAYPSCDVVQESFLRYTTAADLAGGGIGNCPGNANALVVASKIKTYLCPADGDPPVDATYNPGSVPDATLACRSNYLFSIYSEDLEHLSLLTGPPLTTDDLQGDNLVGLIWRKKQGMFRDNHKTTINQFADGLCYTFAIGETRQQSGFANFKPHWGTGHQGSVTGVVHSSIYPVGMHLNYPVGKFLGTTPDTDPKYYLQMAYAFGSWHPQGANFLFADGSVHFLRNNISTNVYQTLGSMKSLIRNPIFDPPEPIPTGWE